ncbi:MAG: PKD domain-containing protein, partial [Oscillospiraceae bacterium]|nr:PKD domain-containing protein [Oscillospiraceae bacterium]
MTTLTSEIQTLGFNVSGLVPNTSYAFRVAAFDNSGNAGAYTEWLSVTTAADTTAPVISSQSPQPARFNASIPYSVTASDDYGIQKITLQYSVDRVHWADFESKTFTSTNARQTQAFNVNLNDFDEGSLFLRGIAEDVYGNVSASDETAPYVQYIVDRTPPQKPQQVSAVGSDGFITVSWAQGNESDLGTYTLYRSDSENGDYEIIAASLSSVNYHDRSVTREQLYYYKLAVYDTAGNLSEMSEPVCAAASADDEAPKVNSISPASDSRIGTANNKISVLFSDNNQLSTAIIEYKTSLFSEYSVLKETANIGNYYQTVEATIPLNDLTDGDKVYIRASCTDTAGHASDKVTASFIVDKQAPSVVDLSVTQTNSSVELGWNDASDADLAGFKVFKKVDDAQFVSIGARKASDTHQYTFTDQLSYGTVQYRVDAVDKVGNISSFYTDALTIEKGSLLQAVIETATYLEAGVQEFFSAENSVSDELVTVYTWDFGDGTFSNDERAVKSYAEPGEYTVTLTIEDVSGQVDSTEKVISVHERKMLGTANVLVTDENGLPLPYMPVYFDLGESNPQIVYTNASGVASYMMSVGTHSVGFYMDDYLPQAANVDILSGKTTETKLVAQEQDLVTGEFEVHEMDYDEIIAAGIDLDAVDNQQIYKVTVVLTYESKRIPVTYVRNSTSILSVDFGDFGGSSVEPGPSSGSGTDWHPQIQYVPNQSGQEIIAILSIPEVTASYLKPFYSANLYILNNAAEGFDIVDCEATIHAPDGLTVVQSTPMKTVIGGGETAYAGWVLRGDQEGTYDLSADFSGILDRFNAPVSVSFQAENPVIVYGADSIQIVVETPEHIFNNLPEDNTSVSGANYKYEPTAYVNIGVKNVSNRDLYNVKLTKPIDPSEPDQTVDIDAEYQSNAGDVSELPKQLTLRDSSKNKTYILDSNGTRTEIPFNSVVILAPGETLFRYYAVEFNAKDELHWFKEEYAQDLYYELRDCVVKVSDYEGLTYTTVVDNERFYDYYIRTGEPADGNLEFVYGTTDDNKCRKLPVTYSDSFFTQDSRTMNPELAKTTLRLELAGYSSAAYNAAYSHTLSEDNLARATNIMSAYSQMGFSNDKYVGYNTPLTDGSDKAAFSMAMKHIDNGEGSTDTLVALVVRGGGYGAEWASNFNIGTEGNHVGFDGAAQ